MANLNNHIMTFIKIAVITTSLFGGLLAQSYATNLFTDSIMSLNGELAGKEVKTVKQQAASNFSVGQLKINLQSDFLKQPKLSNQEQLLAAINLSELPEIGQLKLISAPSKYILRHKWAQVELNTEAVQQAINFKFQ